MNMGVEPFLVTASVNTIVAQRLLRMNCSQCKAEQAIPKVKLIEIGFPPEVVESIRCFRGTGCNICDGTGYKGRIAIYEVMDFNSKLKEMVLKGATAHELRSQSIVNGMKTLRQAALTKVAHGMTSLEEAISITTEN
jgi:type IV pilus assembly protein PilB